MVRKPILCLDFDGVLHSYTSGWRGASVISDPPVAGAANFIEDALKKFDVQIFSSRSNQEGGLSAMEAWLVDVLREEYGVFRARDMIKEITFPTEKPTAMVSIDDRAITFKGDWPDVNDLLNFKPWNKE